MKIRPMFILGISSMIIIMAVGNFIMMMLSWAGKVKNVRADFTHPTWNSIAFLALMAMVFIYAYAVLKESEVWNKVMK